MKVMEIFFDPNGRKNAILQSGKTFVIAWKSLSQGKWLVAPFAIDILDRYWISKGKSDEIPTLPKELCKVLDKMDAPQLQDANIKSILSRCGLLKISQSATQKYVELVKFFKGNSREIHKNIKQIAFEMTRAALFDIEPSLKEFYAKFRQTKKQKIQRKKPKPKEKPKRRPK